MCAHNNTHHTFEVVYWYFLALHYIYSLTTLQQFHGYLPQLHICSLNINFGTEV